jgi:hypothetical protein
VEAREYLGTPRSEAAVRKALNYLGTTQSPDGHWDGGSYRRDVGITGLCLMAFLAAGHQPGRGRYGVTINEAIDYLCHQVHSSGSLVAPGLIQDRSGQSGPPMYGHGFATLALAESYGMTTRRDVKAKIEAAIRLIEDTQCQDNRPEHDGGWRYQPAPNDADISVTIVQVMALRAARNAGLKVPQATIDRAVAYMKRCANKQDGGFSYQVGQQQSGPARTGAAVLSLIMAGQRWSPECRDGLRYLMEHPYDRANMVPYREHFYYALYYVTQAMYQAGGAYWLQWFPPIRDELVRTQSADGSWNREDNNSEAGVVYATAMAVLVLQVPAGLLPIYQK